MYLNENSIPAIIALLFCVLLYIEGTFNNIRRTGRDYIKAFVVIYGLSYLSIYMFTNKGKQSGGGALSFLNRTPIREDIFVGTPNF
jgi:hypothetical protein